MTASISDIRPLVAAGPIFLTLIPESKSVSMAADALVLMTAVSIKEVRDFFIDFSLLFIFIIVCLSIACDAIRPALFSFI
jgi:hypothetical protein